MKKTKFLIVLIIVSIVTLSGCRAQKNELYEFSNNAEMNYIFSRISKDKPLMKVLYDGGLFITIFKISDSKATPSKYLEDFVSSYIISVTPDGDYYSWSKLYKLEGLYNSKILEIKETNYPYFMIKVEHGVLGKEIVEIFKLQGEF